MKILLAPDKFKGSLTAPEVCQAMAAGIGMVSPEIEVVSLPMADGGEGTLEILLWYANGRKILAKVHDPLGRIIEAEFGISADGKTAFIEMARASGLQLLQKNEYNPLITSTLGTGELINEALKMGAENIILGIGGSATNDAGIGMAKALGWRFFDKNNNELAPTGENLGKIERINPTLTLPEGDTATPSPSGRSFSVACDVTNPLYGENGAAYIYAPQKGADNQAVMILDEGLKHFAGIVKRDFGHDFAHIAGAGAAGGLGFGTNFFLNAELKEGVNLLMDYCDFDKHLDGVALVITGEGKIDEQTLQGKLIKGITDRAKSKNISVAALCGTLEISPEKLQKMGILYANSILKKPQSLDEALKNAYADVRDATFYLVNLWKSLR